MPTGGKDSSIRQRTGSYQHLSPKEVKSALESSKKNMQDQKDNLYNTAEELGTAEMRAELRETDLDQDNPDSKSNAKAVDSERQMTNKPITSILQPKHVAQARRRVYNNVMKNLERAEQVLAGRRKWTASQVTLFSKMLNKVIPDLHHSVSDVSHSFSGNVNDIALEDLMRIAMEESQVIDAEVLADDPDIEDAEYSEPENTVSRYSLFLDEFRIKKISVIPSLRKNKTQKSYIRPC